MESDHMETLHIQSQLLRSDLLREQKKKEKAHHTANLIGDLRRLLHFARKNS